MEDVPATYEQLLHILEAGVKTVSSSQDGTGSGYIYEYVFPTTAANSIKTYTIEGGDNTEEEEFTYGFVESFTLSGAPGESVMMGADWVGREVSTGTFTASSGHISGRRDPVPKRQTFTLTMIPARWELRR